MDAHLQAIYDNNLAQIAIVTQARHTNRMNVVQRELAVEMYDAVQAAKAVIESGEVDYDNDDRFEFAAIFRALGAKVEQHIFDILCNFNEATRVQAIEEARSKSRRESARAEASGCCWRCLGSGIKACPRCSGTGALGFCDFAKKSLPCKYCNSTGSLGKCKECRGIGIARSTM